MELQHRRTTFHAESPLPPPAPFHLSKSMLAKPIFKQGVCHATMALPFTLKNKIKIIYIYIYIYIKAKEELWKLKYFTIQNYNLQKIL
jgi:hypothetical protein